jgi:hypothetical protein
MARDVRNMDKADRIKELMVLQEAYPHFHDFLYDVIVGLMGFQCTPNQIDMARYLEFGPLYRMIQAQRGQAKTTVTAAYAVWRLIHNPADRILIISSGDTMAKEISNWVIQIISGMEELSCLLPDRSRGDRASVSAYDVHGDLKGPEKSPSVACVGITSNLQGKRADVLIADDIESAKNSLTAEMREKLINLSRDFTSICSNGDIIYLGTPQSVDSIYNTLPGRGFDIRIWPGRYPAPKELENYGDHLAPFILNALKADPSLQSGGGLLGDRGQPTDNIILGEDILIKKEIDQGAAYFQLQHMLDTRLSDAARYPLKLQKLIFMSIGPKTSPLIINHQPSIHNRIAIASDYPIKTPMYAADNFGKEHGEFVSTHMYVDPAGGGQNGDETAYAVTRFLGNRVYLVDIGGVPGGLDASSMAELTKVAVKWLPNKISIERNYGNGALQKTWEPTLFAALAEEGAGTEIDDPWESGQKELRIIDTLEPVIGSGRLVVDTDLIESDWESVGKYPAANRASYSLFHQLSKITRDRGSLFHDDRLDALAGSVRNWIDLLAVNETQAAAAAESNRYHKMMQDPLGTGQAVPGYNSMFGLGGLGIPNATNRFQQRF